MNQIKVWPHMTIVAVVVALIAGLGVAYWMKHEQTASAEELPYAARIQRVDGEVAFSDGLPDGGANGEWVAATPNQPFSVGDRIYTRENARTSLAFTGRNFARLNPNTSLDVVSLGDRRTQLALREGSAMFDLGYLQPDELFEVATPYGAVDFDQPGLYNVGFDNNGGVLVSVLSGLARVVGLGGSGEINKGEVLSLLGQSAAQVALSRLNGDDAGYLVDDYYRYQYPNYYDGRYNNYDAYLSDPYYYDPYRRNASYQYASSTIPGLYDLDHYGDWQNVDGYGYAWRPRVDSSWIPYQQGYWTNDYPYGPTWVSSEPWGYAPYHYGRWANVGSQWYWIPDAVNTTPVYSPALVAFVPVDANQIGWVPLGPGDPYAQRYYDDNWQPHYLADVSVIPANLRNFGIPGAVTVVPVDAFGRPIDPRMIRRVDGQVLASVRPTLDPLTFTPLRNAVINSAWGRGKIDLPPGIARKLNSTRVFVGSEPKGSWFKKDVARSLQVERVPDKSRNEKFKVRDERQAQQADNGRKPDVNPGRKDVAPPVSDGGRGNKPDNVGKDRVRQPRQQELKSARTQPRQIRAQQPVQRQAPSRIQQQPQGERVGNPARQQPQGERVGNPARQQPQGERVGNPAKAQPQPKQQAQGAPKPERQQGPPAKAQGNAGGGKAKGKGKP